MQLMRSMTMRSEKVDEIRSMEQLVESDTVGCVYYSATLLLADENNIRLQKCAEEIVQMFTNLYKSGARVYRRKNRRNAHFRSLLRQYSG